MSPEMQALARWAGKAVEAARQKPSATTFGEYLDGCLIKQLYTKSDLDGKPRIRVSLSTTNFTKGNAMDLLETIDKLKRRIFDEVPACHERQIALDHLFDMKMWLRAATEREDVMPMRYPEATR